MLRHELEKRIRHLETGLDQFSGFDWIVKVGEIAEIKGAVLDMSEEIETVCAGVIKPRALEMLDMKIDAALAGKDSLLHFQQAYGTLREWLTPALPGQQGSEP